MVVVDDHRAVRELLASSLRQSEGTPFEVVAEGGTGQEAVDLCVKHRPDLLLLDVVLPGFNGVEVLSRLRRRMRGLQVARLVAEGKSTKEAAAILGISAKTLDKHRSSMMQKLDLHDAVSVTRYAILAGLTSLD